MKVNGKTVKEPFKVKGHFLMIINGDDIAMVAKAVNANADILKQAMIKIEQLEKKIETLNGRIA